jgi:hypothetical protein
MVVFNIYLNMLNLRGYVEIRHEATVNLSATKEKCHKQEAEVERDLYQAVVHEEMQCHIHALEFIPKLFHDVALNK